VKVSSTPADLWQVTDLRHRRLRVRNATTKSGETWTKLDSRAGGLRARPARQDCLCQGNWARSLAPDDVKSYSRTRRQTAALLDDSSPRGRGSNAMFFFPKRYEDAGFYPMGS
jgi:hypothetical protein